METDAASANLQRGPRLLQAVRLAAAETAPELPRRHKRRRFAPVTGHTSQSQGGTVPLEFTDSTHPWKNNSRGVFLFP